MSEHDNQSPETLHGQIFREFVDAHLAETVPDENGSVEYRWSVRDFDQLNPCDENIIEQIERQGKLVQA